MWKFFPFYLLALALTLSLLECSSLKRKRDEDEEGAGGGSSGSIEESTKTAVVPAENGFQLLAKFEEGIFASMASFGVEIQSLLRVTCKDLKNLIDSYRPLQRRLSLDLNIPSFLHLPLHPDLLVFEGLRFPRTLEGRVDALVYVFRTLETVLFNSSVRDAVTAAMLNEAANLAKSDVAAFKNFTSISKICWIEPKKLFFPLLEANNISGYIAWKRACGSARARITSDIFKSVPIKYVSVLASYLNEHPEDFLLLIDGRLTHFSLFALLSTELPESAILEVLRPWSEDFRHALPLLNDAFRFDFSSLPLPVDHYARMLLSTLTFLKEHYDAQAHSSSDDCEKIYRTVRLLHTCRFDEQVLIKELLTAVNAENFCLSLLGDYLPLMLIEAGKPAEALEYLPARSRVFMEEILENSEFCALIAREKPEWILNNFVDSADLVYRNRDWVLSCFDFSSFEQFFAKAGQDKLLVLGPLIYQNGTIEEAQALIARVHANAFLQMHFVCFLELQMPNDRYMALLLLFLQALQAHPHQAFVPTLVNPSAERFVLLFGEDSPVRARLMQRPFNCQFLPKLKVVAELLNSPELRPKFFAAREFVMVHFGDAIKQRIVHLCAPFEIMNALIFIGLDPEDSLDRIFELFVDNHYDIVSKDLYDFVVGAIALDRTMDLIDPGQIDAFTAPGYFLEAFPMFALRGPRHEIPRHTEEILRRLYDAASARLKVIMDRAVFQAEQIKNSTGNDTDDDTESSEDEN